jgi:hypothetical protein
LEYSYIDKQHSLIQFSALTERFCLPPLDKHTFISSFLLNTSRRLLNLTLRRFP